MHERDAKFIFRQVLFGVQYLHDNNVVHRDLKAFIDSTWHWDDTVSHFIKILTSLFNFFIFSPTKFCRKTIPTVLSPKSRTSERPGSVTRIWARTWDHRYIYSTGNRVSLGETVHTSSRYMVTRSKAAHDVNRMLVWHTNDFRTIGSCRNIS